MQHIKPFATSYPVKEEGWLRGEDSVLNAAQEHNVGGLLVHSDGEHDSWSGLFIDGETAVYIYVDNNDVELYRFAKVDYDKEEISFVLTLGVIHWFDDNL